MSKPKIKARYGFTDLIVDADVNLSKYVPITPFNGTKVVGEIQLSLIGYEDEDGNECDENGEEL